ncbi:MAG: UMP kinase, partial [Candidatus Magasanikbacteria bacterium]|nr:UMP kinase [Candidatus Magasanikbacteria bacterium]
IPRSASDAIGMMATIMNARLLAEALRSIGVKAHALAAHGEFYYAEPYTPDRGRQLLDRKEVVICGGGTGNPFFTTDTAAALRALELDCDVLMKATKDDGVYDKDPMKSKNAKFFSKISYDEVLKRELEVMDLTSIVLCKENKLPVHVFNLTKTGNMRLAVKGKKIGTLIT